jgi:hypothetical protein
MAQLTRYCPECSEERPFEQFHPTGCPDVPDGDCPEWGCTACGDAVIIGMPARGYITGDSAPRAA